MNTATPSPMQGEGLSWQLICVADALDDLNKNHAFLTALYEKSRNKGDTMDADAQHLLFAYMEKEPRQTLTELSDRIMAVARSMRDLC